MKNCKYILYTGEDAKEYTWELLIDFFVEQSKKGDNDIYNINDVSDIVYSKGNKLTHIIEKLISDKKDFYANINEALNFDTDPSYKTKDSLSLQEFIDDATLYVFRGSYHPVRSLDKEAFIKLKIKLLVNEGFTLNDAEIKVLTIIDNWATICEDSKIIHEILNGFNWDNKSLLKGDFIEYVRTVNPKFESIADKLYNLIGPNDKSHTSCLRAIMYGRHRIGDKGAKIISNINLIGHINTCNKDIVAHYDNIVIDFEGGIHIYDYVYSSEPINYWSKDKYDKYKAKMALKKLILAQNGYNVNNCTLHLVPILAVYSSDFSNISDIIVSSSNNLELTIKNNKYIFDELDSIARYFIKASSSLSEEIDSKTLDKINTSLSVFLPLANVKAMITELTADEWISRNYNHNVHGKILKSDKPEYAYKVYLTDDYKEPKYIKETTHPSKNEEIKKLVNDNISLLSGTVGNTLSLVKSKIKSYKSSGNINIFDEKSFGESLLLLEKVLRPYLKEIPNLIDSDKKLYEWELVDNDVLESAGILVFENRKGEHDFVTLTNLDLYATVSLNGRENILQSYVPDNEVGDLINFKNTYANIQALRTVIILNEALANWGGNASIMGKLNILSLFGKGENCLYDIKDLATNILPKMYKIIKPYHKDYVFQNNFHNKVSYVNPIQNLIDEYKVISAGLTDSESKGLSELNFELFEGTETLSLKREKLLNLLNKIEIILSEKFYLNSEGLENIKEIANRRENTERNALCLLYLLAQKALHYYADFNTKSEDELTWVEENTFKLSRVPNATYRLVGYIYTLAIDKISEETNKMAIPILLVIRDFYNASGYSNILNNLIGNQSSLYDNLYSEEVKMSLKNPYLYTPENQLKDYERTFLKKILFHLNKIRSLLQGFEFDFDSFEDIDADYVEAHPEYLIVPLERVTKATNRSNILSGKSNFTLRLKDKAQKVKDWFNDIGSKSTKTKEEISQMKNLRLKSNFAAYDKESNDRTRALIENPDDYWETNLETIIIDYCEDYNRTKELNKAFIEVKSILLELDLLGESISYVKGVLQTKKMIHDYILKNFFNESIMTPAGKKAENWIKPFRTLVSRAFIAGNLVSAFRDVTEGLLLNTMRTINKFLTDLNSTNLAKAYGYVTTHMWQDCMSINKIDLLCKIYRLSNMDVARISEGLKSNRGGFLNYENWMYATLRKPDFLNRMVLFVARCMQDGCWEAFNIKNGLLIYDPEKDKRYNIYLSGLTTNSEYIKQRNAYYNAMKDYNDEHGTNLTIKDKLPSAYSNREINQFRELSNSIYGAYDASMRAGYENMFIGVMCGSFTTWMNGIWANMATRPGVYADGAYKEEEDIDANGNLRYIDQNMQTVVEEKQIDGTSIFKYEDSGEFYTDGIEKLEKKHKYVPEVILGTWYTLKHAFYALKNHTFRKEIYENPKEWENSKKLLSDLLAGMIIALLFKMVLTPGYKAFLKNEKEHSALTSALAYLTYTASSRSYDGFLGPINVFLQLGENMNPPFYTLPLKITTDLSKVVFGDKTIANMLTNDFAVWKNALGFYKHYIATNS